MNRRTYLASFAVVPLAGCTAGGDSDDPSEDEDGGNGGAGADVSAVTITGEDAIVEDAPIEIDIRWTSRAQAGVDPDPDHWASFTPSDGEKYVVIRGEVTATSDLDEQINVRHDILQLRTDGVYHSPTQLAGGPDTLQATVDPGATYGGWNTYPVDEDVTEATLVANTEHYATDVSVTLEHDADWDVDMAAP